MSYRLEWLMIVAPMFLIVSAIQLWFGYDMRYPLGLCVLMEILAQLIRIANKPVYEVVINGSVVGNGQGPTVDIAKHN